MTPDNPDLTERFARLFHGRTDAHGLGRGAVKRTSITREDVEQHLAGEHPDGGIGIFPLRADGTVLWAAIDLDEPDFELAQELQRLLPGQTWIEKSRSGNAHIWAFFTEPIPAWIPRGLMKMALQSHGRDDVEVFPKQDRLPEGLLGNYINLPFYGDTRPMLSWDGPHAHTGGGVGPWTWGLESWIDRAEASKTDPDVWRRRATSLGIKPPEEREGPSAEFGTMPNLHRCASHIIANAEENPVSRGGRHVVFFNLAKMLLNWREIDDAEAMEYLREVNELADPPLSDTELQRIFGNVQRGQFVSTGCDSPEMAPYISPDCEIVHG